MKVHRFCIQKLPGSGLATLTDSSLVHQINQVLKLRPSETIELFDGKGSVCRAKIIAVHADRIECEVSTSNSEPMPSRSVTLMCAMLKREHFEWVVQKATEVGVAVIIPLITSRTVKTGMRRERLEKICKEASEQSGRLTIPELFDPITLRDACALLSSFDRVWCCSTSGAVQTFTLQEITRVAVLIGPEGGFTAEEETAVVAAGATLCSLGATTLRAETAATIASFLALH